MVCYAIHAVSASNFTTRKVCTNSAAPVYTVDQIKKAVFAELNPNQPTVGGTFNQCSYGKSQLTQNNSDVAPMVQLNCSGLT